MVPQQSRQPLSSQPFADTQYDWDSIAVEAIPQLLEIEAATEAPLAPRSVTETCLNWDSLSTFTLLSDQFQDLGVVFDNAVVVEPSNPAYPTYSGDRLVTGSPKSGWITASFIRPVKSVSGRITCSQPMLLIAFDPQQRIVAQEEITDANLATSETGLDPNQLLQVKAEDIQSVKFHCLGGQLTIAEFSFY
ncbi:MAG: hypothetical protein F6K04_06790 [Leptolyngbya sp. SIO4C5]|nr:hypothetical protein [Leptolyngbya sp. SIO4C5]